MYQNDIVNKYQIALILNGHNFANLIFFQIFFNYGAFVETVTASINVCLSEKEPKLLYYVNPYVNAFDPWVQWSRFLAQKKDFIHPIKWMPILT